MIFRYKYFIAFILLLLIETGIALFVHDGFIRPYFGDVLVVILIYCFVKSFIDISVLKAAVIVLFFAFAVEALQYIHIIDHLQLRENAMARTIIGHRFSWGDLVSYVAGIAIVLMFEAKHLKI